MLSFLCPATPVTAPFAALTNQPPPKKSLLGAISDEKGFMERFNTEKYKVLRFGGPLHSMF